MKEIEIKLKYKSKNVVEGMLKQIGAVKTDAYLLRDTYYFNGKETNLTKVPFFIRIRQKDGAAELTYKGPYKIIKGIKSRTELNIRIENAQLMERILQELGFKIIRINESFREIWKLGDMEFAFQDFKKPIKINILEIEGPDKNRIKEVANKLRKVTSLFTEKDYNAFDSA